MMNKNRTCRLLIVIGVLSIVFYFNQRDSDEDDDNKSFIRRLPPPDDGNAEYMMVNNVADVNDAVAGGVNIDDVNNENAGVDDRQNMIDNRQNIGDDRSQLAFNQSDDDISKNADLIISNNTYNDINISLSSTNELVNDRTPLMVNGVPVYLDLNYELEQVVKQIERKIIRGLGDYGQPVTLVDGASQAEIDAELKKEAINRVLSDRIPYDREVPDQRHPSCKEIKYREKLPSASVVIIFHNEIWSLLLRTVHTVLQRTPKSLLKEIVLVDDASDRDELKAQLDYYVATRLPPGIVRIVRLSKRSGLIRTRIAGAKAAQAPVVVFLDSHCEAGIDWLQPILQRIKNNPKTVVMPIVEWIDRKHFGYMSGPQHYTFKVGGFTWSGFFIFADISEREQKRRKVPTEPARSPTMLGGLLALNRNFFWDVGAYDDGMEIWGGENLEMSFRVWQCGGVLEVHPCSRVGHVFRPVRPYSFDGKNDTHGYNTARLAEVWMDDYKRFFYLHKPQLKELNVGNIEHRKELRKKLQCKDFRWYLNNVMPEKFILDEHSQHWGRIRAYQKNICIDTLQKPEYATYNLGAYNCHSTMALSQYFSLSNDDELRREYVCAEITGSNVTMTICNGRYRQKWKFTKNGEIQHVQTNMCISHYKINTANGGTHLKTSYCSGDSVRWEWEYSKYGNGTTVDNFKNN